MSRASRRVANPGRCRNRDTPCRRLRGRGFADYGRPAHLRGTELADDQSRNDPPRPIVRPSLHAVFCRRSSRRRRPAHRPRPQRLGCGDRRRVAASRRPEADASNTSRRSDRPEPRPRPRRARIEQARSGYLPQVTAQRVVPARSTAHVAASTGAARPAIARGQHDRTTNARIDFCTFGGSGDAAHLGLRADPATGHDAPPPRPRLERGRRANKTRASKSSLAGAAGVLPGARAEGAGATSRRETVAQPGEAPEQIEGFVSAGHTARDRSRTGAHRSRQRRVQLVNAEQRLHGGDGAARTRPWAIQRPHDYDVSPTTSCRRWRARTARRQRVWSARRCAARPELAALAGSSERAGAHRPRDARRPTARRSPRAAACQRPGRRSTAWPELVRGRRP